MDAYNSKMKAKQVYLSCMKQMPTNKEELTPVYMHDMHVQTHTHSMHGDEGMRGFTWREARHD
jgi:hypothetical protein